MYIYNTIPTLLFYMSFWGYLADTVDGTTTELINFTHVWSVQRFAAFLVFLGTD
jgi:hypothetical protein